jgi:N-sulfoglucosamine sulfohydrolase
MKTKTSNHRIIFLPSILLPFLLPLVLVSAWSYAGPPNVLLIVSEDNGPELGCYGDAYARTPNLDKLADEGVRFNRAFVAQAGCSQSRASFLTGLYPHQHGQIGLATWGFRMYRDDTPNLPRSLKAVGYRTGIIGKLHINPESAFPFDFHEFTTANFNRKNLSEYARQSERFINAGEEPFFLSVNYPDAHDPWIRQVDGLPKSPQTGSDVKAMAYMGIDPPEMREMVADYYNCISRLDSLIGDLLGTLDRSGKDENTIVIYIGDHGADMLRGKRTSYEGGVRVPMIMRWPGYIKPHVEEALVSTVDIMPTVLEAANASPVAGLPGRPLQPLMSGETATWRDYLFTEYHTHAAAPNYHPQRAVRNDRFKLIENLLPDTLNPDYANTIRKLEGDATSRGEKGFTGGLHNAIANASSEVVAAYALMETPPLYELYDLQADPYEFHNLAASPEHASTLVDLQTQLTNWREQTKDPLLDPKNLQSLTAEVTAVTNKSEGKSRQWGYVDYFFGKASIPTTVESGKKKGKKGKKKQ